MIKNNFRTLVMGDIHGSLESLTGVLKIASYDPKYDRLICLGDYIDGWTQSFEVVDALLQYQLDSPHENIYLLGNHDQYFIYVLDDGIEQMRNEDLTMTINAEWWEQGGEATYRSYIVHSDDDIRRHKEMFYDRLKYCHMEANQLFVHGGFNPRLGLEATMRIDKGELLMNRLLYEQALHHSDPNTKFGDFDKIFIGHTPTISSGHLFPRPVCNVINLDQGCKLDKRLTAWVLETGEWYQYEKGL